MNEGKMTEPQLVVNGQGVTIKSCCASCEWMTVSETLLRANNSIKRYCIKHNLTVNNNERCDCYTMKRFWKAFVLKGDGQVKSKEYLVRWAKTVNDYTARIDKAKDSGDKLTENRLRDELDEFKRKEAELWES